MGETTSYTEIIEIKQNPRLKEHERMVITIPRNIIKYLRKKYSTDILRLIIKKEEEVKEYFIEANTKYTREVTVEEERKYTVSIEPYNIKKFLKDFNSRISSKFRAELSIHGGKLVLKVDGFNVEAIKWTFEREFGGGLSIKAEFPSIIRKDNKITLKFQLKNSEAYIRLVEKRSNRRDTTYNVINMLPFANNLIIVYLHGKSKITTLLTVDTEFDLDYFITPKRTPIKIQSIENKTINNEPFSRYTYNISDNNMREGILHLLNCTYKFKLANKKQSGELFKEQIGIILAKVFLKQIGITGRVYMKPLKKPFGKLKKYFKRKEPDLFLITEDNKIIVIEIKYRGSERAGRKALLKGINQVKEYFNLVATYGDRVYRGLYKPIGKMVIVAGYNPKTDKGYIYIWKEIEDEK